MKNNLAFIILAAGVAVAGCSKLSESPSGMEGDFPKSFRVSLDGAFISSTKAYFDDEDSSFVWEDGDLIAVNGATYVRNNRNGEFSYYCGGFTTAPGGSIVGVYPVSLYAGGSGANTSKYALPSSYLWNSETEKLDFVPQAGVSDDNCSIRFRHLVSLFKVNMTNSSSDTVWLKSISLSSDKSMSGEFTMSFGSDSIPLLSFVSSGDVHPSVGITLDKAVKVSPQASYSLYLPVPAQRYGMFNVKVSGYSADGENEADLVSYTRSATTGTGTSYTVDSLVCERAKLYAFNINASSFVSGGMFEFDASSNTYNIDGAAGFRWFAEQVACGNDFSGMTVKLTSSVNLNNTAMDPIGTQTLPFRGTFDGDYNVISNFLVNAGTEDNVGLFGYVEGTIKNVILKNGSVTGGSNVGALVGHITGNVENCTVSRVNVTATDDPAQNVGGLAGEVVGSLTGNTVEDVYVRAENGENVGGVAGKVTGGQVTGNTAEGTIVEAKSNVGGLIGDLVSGEVSGNSVVSVEVISNNLDGSGTGTNVNQVVGKNEGGTVSSDNTVENVNVSNLEFDAEGNLNVSSGGVWNSIANFVNAGNDMEGKTITLTSDISLTSARVVGDCPSASPIGTYDEENCVPFKGTLDGQGHTISDLYQNGWDLGYEFYNWGAAGLFAAVENATIKNLTISNSETYVEGGVVSAVAGYAKGTCTFKSITIENSKVASYNNDLGGIVGYADAGTYVFEDIHIGSDVVLAGLWGSYDCPTGGIIGEIETGKTNITIKNSTVACRVDAYNDITASYQYGIYRMCGMLVGWVHSTQTVSGTTYPNPAAENLTCEGVTVTYGSWMNYHYCKYKDGSRNWLRVEEGYNYGGVTDHTGHLQCNKVYAFDQLFGGGQYGVAGLKTYAGVTVVYP